MLAVRGLLPIGFHSIPPDSTLVQPSEDADSTPRKRILPEKICLLAARQDMQCTQQSEITLERGMLIVTSALRRKMFVLGKTLPSL